MRSFIYSFLFRGDGFMLKVIALITMIIDHIGYFGNIECLRLIGRLSFPIYCFLISRGIKKTKNIKNYLLRILCLAIVSQIIWNNAGVTTLNVLFTYFLFIQMIHFIRSKKYILASITLLIIIIVSPILDYGFYGFVLLLIFYYIEDKYVRLILMLGAVIYFIKYKVLSEISLIALLSIFIIDKYDKPKWYKKYKKYNKLFYYIYPLHILIISEIFKYFK